MAILSGISNTVMAVVTGVAVVPCIGLSAALWWQGRGVADLKADNARLTRSEAVLTRQMAQAREAMAVAQAHAVRERELRAQAAAVIDAIRNLPEGSCLDETIDPDLADLLGRL